MTEPTPAVSFRGVRRSFGSVSALAGFDLEVPQGGCFGLLGPNGAGKSTAVKVATTLIRASGGEVRVLGRDVSRDRAWVRQQIGIVFQEPCLDRALTAREHLEFHARLYRLDDRSSRIQEALARAGLAQDADRLVLGFSGGMSRRLEIARGLMHRPRLLFLDEPTLGLDVAARRAVWDQIRELVSRDTTVFLTTHGMEEVEALCDHIAIIDAGLLVTEGTPDSLKAALGGDVVTLVVEDIPRAREALTRHPVVREIEVSSDGGSLRLVVSEGSKHLIEILDAVRDCRVGDVRLERPTLENVFLHHTGHGLKAGEEVEAS